MTFEIIIFYFRLAVLLLRNIFTKNSEKSLIYFKKMEKVLITIFAIKFFLLHIFVKNYSF